MIIHLAQVERMTQAQVRLETIEFPQGLKPC